MRHSVILSLTGNSTSLLFTKNKQPQKIPLGDQRAGGIPFELNMLKTEPMDLQPFFIEYYYGGNTYLTEVKPCCQQDNVIFYDVWMNNTYQFTITPNSDPNDAYSWRVALINADNPVDHELVETIGQNIDQQNGPWI